MNTFLIKYGHSRSINYKEVVDLSEMYGTYTFDGTYHAITFYDPQINSFFELYDMVRKWKSANAYINGELLTHQNSHFLWCLRRRILAPNGEDYCFGKDDQHQTQENFFGCRRLGLFHYFDGLNGFGYMDEEGNFHVDKNKIANRIVSDENHNLCPSYNIQGMMLKIDELPDMIKPSINSEWEYITRYDEDTEIAVSVRKKEKIKGYKIPTELPNEKVVVPSINNRKADPIRFTKISPIRKSKKRRSPYQIFVFTTVWLTIITFFAIVLWFGQQME